MPETKEYFILSDLHLEFWKGKEEEFWETFPETSARVCLCAGDLTSLGLPDSIVHKHFSRLIQHFEKVIYVPGNHDYYGSSTSEIPIRLARLEEYLNPNLKVLRSGCSYTYNGQRFIGDTMWFPDTPGVHIYKRMINDGYQIKNLLPWAFEQSNAFMAFIKEEIREDDIVITHHIPSDIDTAICWKGSPTQSYFLNVDCHRYLLNPNNVRPKAWIYGHTHDYHKFNIGNTQVICNPAGYPTENPKWRQRQLVYKL